MWSNHSLENMEETMFLLQKKPILHPESADDTKTTAPRLSFTETQFILHIKNTNKVHHFKEKQQIN